MSASRTPAQVNKNDNGVPAPHTMQTTVPLASIDHEHPANRASNTNFNGPRGADKGGSLHSGPAHRNKRDSPAGTPSHSTKASTSTGFFYPASKSGPGEGGFRSTLQSGGPAANSHPSPKMDASNAVPEKKGRRGNHQGNENWFEKEKSNRPADKELDHGVATMQDGAVDQETVRREQAERAQRQAEQLAQHISNPPTGFQASLPRLNELDVTNSWDKLLRMIRNEYDMSCLTNCLARELDEDVTWNPEMLLVQLTSDMMDAAELQKENDVYVPVDASDIGQMTGGEVVRRRGEKAAPGQNGAGPTPESGASAGGQPAPKTTSNFVGPDFEAKQSPSKNKSPVPSRPAAGASTSSPRKEGKLMSSKKSGAKPIVKK